MTTHCESCGQTIRRPTSDYLLAVEKREAGLTYREVGEFFGVGRAMGRIMVHRGFIRRGMTPQVAYEALLALTLVLRGKK